MPVILRVMQTVILKVGMITPGGHLWAGITAGTHGTVAGIAGICGAVPGDGPLSECTGMYHWQTAFFFPGVILWVTVHGAGTASDGIAGVMIRGVTEAGHIRPGVIIPSGSIVLDILLTTECSLCMPITCWV